MVHEGEGAQLRMLAEASRAFGIGGDTMSTMTILAETAAANIGDACSVQILSEDRRELRLLASSHTDPEAKRMLQELSHSSLPADGAFAEVLRTDRPMRIAAVDEQRLRQAYDEVIGRYLDRFPVRTLMAVPLRVDGRLIGLVAMSRTMPDAPYTAAELALLEALTERAEMAIVTAQSLHSAEEERRRLEAVLVEAERARDALEVEVLERRRAEVRQRCLTEATAVLASSLEHEQEQAGETRLGAVAGCLVPQVAEWCAIDLIGTDASRSAGAHADPAKTELVRALRARWPPTATRCGLLGVMRTRRAALCTEISHEELEAAALDAEQLATLRELGVASMVVAPIQTGELLMGALTLVRGRADERRFDEADLRFAEELARRIAISLHNADLYQAARAAVGARDEFLSIASHELKTPLTALQLLLQSLHAAALKGPVAQPLLCDRLARAERQVSRVDTLIRELLDASRLSQGRFPIQRIQLDLAEVTRAVVRRLEELAERGQCPMRLSTNPTIGHWDREGLEQVIENLLVNAIKYGAGAPIEVTVSGDDRHAVLQVTDGGIGIAAGDQERIFDRFERAVSARNYGGLGIGLWLVRRLVEEHQGNVSVVSTPERGSTFRVELPRSPPRAADG